MVSITGAGGAGQRRAEVSTRLAFFVAGFAMASWAALVPYVKANLRTDDGQFGLLLLGLGIGSTLSMPFAGALAARYGCRSVLTAAVGAICLAFPFLAALSSVAGVAAALALFGAGVGCVDCVVNVQAVAVERDGGRPLMSGFHSLFSLGGIAGATGVAALLSAGVAWGGRRVQICRRIRPGRRITNPRRAAGRRHRQGRGRARARFPPGPCLAGVVPMTGAPGFTLAS